MQAPRGHGPSRGWLGVYLDVPVDWGEISQLVEDAYRLVAPRRLVDEFDVTRAPKSS